MSEATGDPALWSYTDDQLMQAINSGQVEDSLSVLQSRYGHKVRHFIQSIVKDSWLAQDVAQETFVKVFFKSHLYQIGTSFKAWVFEIARNQALSALRSRRRSPRPVTSLNVADPDGQQNLLEQVLSSEDNRDLEEREFMTAFEDAVSALPENYQTVFRRCVIGGRSYQDVADELKIPTGTVAIRIMRARKRLFQTLSPHFDRLRRPPACIQ
jgi:RNA polymerase sigma-70 factor (ECF subfamily)